MSASDRAVLYAASPDGMRLPVIDVTNPAFVVSATPAELAAMRVEFAKGANPLQRLPRPIRTLIFRVLLRRSRLAQALQGSHGGFMTGLDTYGMKLGPENLAPWGNEIDVRIAGSLPVLSMRLRLQDVATLIAARVRPLLEAERRRALHLVDSAGGPAMCVLNALIVLVRDAKALVTGRAIAVHVLDGDAEGPTFGARALAVLRGPGGPLEGLDVSLRHVPTTGGTFPRRRRARRRRFPVVSRCSPRSRSGRVTPSSSPSNGRSAIRWCWCRTRVRDVPVDLAAR